MSANLETEIKYFEAHQAQLADEYPGRFVVIRNETVLGAFDDTKKAMSAGVKAFGMTPFLVRRTDHKAVEISIPALALGILRADTHL